MQKAVFLDRDGTINSDEFGYINKAEDFRLYPFTAKAIQILNHLNFFVFVVTNQSGLARGYLKTEDLEGIHQKMIAELERQNAFITDVFYSPYHREGIIRPFDIEHEDRKPGLGMLKKARSRYDFQLNGSYMIGDKYSDLVFGRNGGLKTILVRTGLGESEFLDRRRRWNRKPHYVVEDIMHAAELIEFLENK
jgi:histidinol-phosphate phosphatase family protein